MHKPTLLEWELKSTSPMAKDLYQLFKILLRRLLPPRVAQLQPPPESHPLYPLSPAVHRDAASFGTALQDSLEQETDCHPRYTPGTH